MVKKAKTAKRGRKPGVKVGPYKMSLSEMSNEIKLLKSEVAKIKKVIG